MASSLGRLPLLAIFLWRALASIHLENIKNIEPADRLKDQNPNVWVEISQLGTKYKPINIGVGFPDSAAPEHVIKALADAAIGENNVRLNQYTRGFGHPRLVAVLSKLYSKLNNRPINELTEILITIGGYQALFCAIMALINPGDEVIIIEPFFDCYTPMTQLAGGIPVYIPLRPQANDSSSSKNWRLNEVELKSKFSDKTKMIIINTPNNPLGKVFTRKELEFIGNLCKQHNVIVLMDEVYEWVTFDKNEHVRMASLPGMWERTLTVGSGGKTFSVTGWKIGWVYGPQNLINYLQLFHQNCVAVCPTPIQEALAIGFEIELNRLGTKECYWNELVATLQKKRNILANILKSANLKPIMPEGGYFFLTDFSNLDHKLPDYILKDGNGTKDYKFAKWLITEKKLLGIPTSTFYSEQNMKMSENYIRFCFYKEEQTLKKAGEVLELLQME